jgi:glycosidase
MPQPMMMEFHVSRQSRDLYQFDESLFMTTGNVVFANFHAARVFAQKMNDRRDLINYPERAVRAGQINAMGLVDEILHLIVEQYRQQRNPLVMAQALAWLEENIGEDELSLALLRFGEDFPPLPVYRREIGLEDYLAGTSLDARGRAVPNREIVLEEMLMLWLANSNPAFSPYLELFDDANLEKGTSYREMIHSLNDFFDTQPSFGPDNENLFMMLRKPALTHPHSLNAQLEFLRTRWSTVLGSLLFRLLRSQDLIKEEEKIVIGFGGPGPTPVPEFVGLEVEPENFSPDRDWMPNLVLIAKNSYVWLDQLSKKYKQPITRLDQIPDEELDSMARWGFTGLWLIGLWERSEASKTIKQLRGNPDAVASAYSLFSYEIAADLGGEEAYQVLRDRTWKRGIRLASDMVPNHMGIDSRWVIEHPDWFVQLPYSPFPSYSFNGPNLSWDGRVGIFIEDHYFDNTDAAVVFKRVDNWTGDAKYVYHGNDGTSMPWNDTAQLNYLLPEVREAVIQTILEVARRFPVIRFDAAMTLAKRHYQRLWYPEPGSGGDIPSRAEHGLTKDQFDAAIPLEFWREVVDRVAQEVPDTLLLAEAFWLMEGYFVRTLGMHRVYNSAFMNMMRDEKNQEYRLVIKNTVEFEPEILKRYVNFMNNPDERTAVDQFGKGDKYFGICTMMATLPGLPMFGHGQVEGFTEKYGMEYRRAYWDERPDGYLVTRHEREIFPLLRRRYLFAEVENFLLYDFYMADGSVNEDVYAYSNRASDERSLVIYHNKWASARGWIRMSSAYPVKAGSGDDRELVRRNLGEGLGLPNDPNAYLIFRDQAGNLEYIRNCQELHFNGLYLELNAYQYHVFLDMRVDYDNEWGQLAQLTAYLEGRGVPSIGEALKELFLQPIHTAYRELVNRGHFEWLYNHRLGVAAEPGTPPEEKPLQPVLAEVEEKLLKLLAEAQELSGEQGEAGPISEQVKQELAAVLGLPVMDKSLEGKQPKKLAAAMEYLEAGAGGKLTLAESGYETWGALFAWVFTHRLGCIEVAEDGETQTDCAQVSRAWIDEWLLGKVIARTLQDMDLDEAAAWRAVDVVRLLTEHSGWYVAEEGQAITAHSLLQSLMKDSLVQSYLKINRYQGLLYYNKESFDELLWWLFAGAVVQIAAESAPAESGAEPATLTTEQQAILLDALTLVKKLGAAQEKSDYLVEKLLQAAKA